MPDLTAEVVATMARLNTSIGPDDPPYPASLTPIAEAVIAVVAERIAEDIENQADAEIGCACQCSREQVANAAHIARTEKP